MNEAEARQDRAAIAVGPDPKHFARRRTFRHAHLLLLPTALMSAVACGAYNPTTGGGAGGGSNNGGSTGDGGSNGSSGTTETTLGNGGAGAGTNGGGGSYGGGGGTGSTGGSSGSAGGSTNAGGGTGGGGSTIDGGAGDDGNASCPSAVPVAAATPTGNPVLPPRWAFGTMWGTYADQVNLAGFGTAVNDATRLRQEYEGDLFWIDSSWLWRDFVSDGSQYICFKFDPQAFPNPATMIAQLNQMHFHFGVWQWPWMGHGCNLFNTAVTNKYFIMAGTQPASTSGAWHGDANPAAFDFTNPAAVAWWQGPGLNQDLANMGVEFWKLDTTATQQNSPINTGGTLSNAAKNYAHEYHVAAYQVSRKFALANHPVAKAVGSARGMILGKSATPQNDQFPAWWTDDTNANWAGFLTEIARAAVLNTPDTAAYWGGDTGGYNGTPTDELYIRWAEYSTFTPLQEYFATKTGGGRGNRYPWTFGAQAQTIIETYNQLRYRLLPFRYNNAQAAYHAAAGRYTYPVAWLNNATDLLVGDGTNSLLVQPMTTQAATTANVALPTGQWIHWWTNRSFSGAAAVSAPIDQEPIFVKAGSILPMIGEYPGAPKIHWTDEFPNDPLTLRIYPAGKTTNLFYEDDGISEGYQGGAFATTLFTSDNTSAHEVVTIGAQQNQKSFNGLLCQRTYILEFPGWATAPAMVTRDGNPMATSSAFPGADGWFYDAANHVLWVKFGPVASGSSTSVSIQ
jgi:alpha-glucosidase (family GH31 glycosyl hydrolase)